LLLLLLFFISSLAPSLLLLLSSRRRPSRLIHPFFGAKGYQLHPLMFHHCHFSFRGLE
jgi:hypothetical protein